jgi:hypothetical protein
VKDLIILNNRFQFLTTTGRWSDEYPDAEKFPTLEDARNAAATCPLANIITQFGFEDQRCVETWIGGDRRTASGRRSKAVAK